MTQSSRRRCSWSAAAGAAAASLVLAACSGGSDPASEETTAPPPALGTVIQPGQPGEPNQSAGPEDYPQDADLNEADVEFMTMMIVHHRQALDMAGLADTRAEDRSVRNLAERIAASQGPEIAAMAAWLEQHDLPVPDAGEHGGHGGAGGQPMPGMLTEDQMDDLAAADGAEFDELFLRGMIEHHQGAVVMAEAVANDGTDLRVSEVAADVGSGQSAEIDRMIVLLEDIT
ncbi:DUF305 domain-containing protein [Mumia zhuanghuii]|uniref:DUF305 domain-containing protein n=2 Tax=Mumia TaxID=1546255 RepID=A0ABW1QQN9_9ACTN|nr:MULTISPECIES: DUF305 domain-containing protein [Mumia]KAA1424505.1 DUF305 domain-containing protein [Mumia zhuanghuii]